MKLRNIAPIKAYHVTDKDFTQFDPKYITDIGFHFAADLDQCKDHVGLLDMEHPILLTVNLHIRNPLHVQDAMYWDDPDYIQNIQTNDQQINQASEESDGLTPPQFRELLVKGGYDSIQYENQYEGSGTAFIVWDPQLITILKKRDVSSWMTFD